MPIHPTALIDRRAEIDAGADIGPYVVIDGPVHVGRGTRLMAHVVVTGHTRIGCDNVVHYGAVLGDAPQDLGFRGGETRLYVGDRNVLREQVYLHRGSRPDSPTSIGNDNYFMGHAHVGHDARLGDRIILANGALLGGHVEVADGVFISGNCVVHQHVRVGTLALLRGLSRTSRDVPPFCLMDDTHTVRGVNRVGLQRAGFSAERIRAVRRAYARLFGRRRNLRAAVAELEAEEPGEDVRHLLEFIRSSRRGVCFGPRQGSVED
jgi:UDP-N-acetylglucosamine acyltransferase